MTSLVLISLKLYRWADRLQTVAVDPYTGIVYIIGDGSLKMMNMNEDMIVIVDKINSGSKISINSKAKEVYPTNPEYGTLTVVNTSNVLNVENPYNLPQSLRSQPYHWIDIAFDNSINNLIVHGSGNSTFSWYNVSTWERNGQFNVKPITKMSTHYMSHPIIIDSKKHLMYATNLYYHNITTIDLLLKNITNTPVEMTPYSMAFDGAHDLLYVIDGGSAKITLIDMLKKNIKNMAVRAIPKSIDIDPARKLIYITYSNDSRLSVIRSETLEIKDYRLNFIPTKITTDPSTNTIYLLHDDFIISVLNVRTHAVEGSFSTGYWPTSFAFDNKNNRLFVANSYDKTISITDKITNTRVD